ncbi:MAG: thioredoxin family protein [Gammaproteobacteria bacterium]|nr:thioredoxin family protein [Gammaproteobacteria bacterium]
MRVQLLTAVWCSSCQREQDIWQRICARHGVTLEIVDLETPAGEAVASRHHLKIMPAVLIDDQPRAIGVQTEDEVEALLAAVEQQTP